jgi:hypothetical protein
MLPEVFDKRRLADARPAAYQDEPALASERRIENSA